MHTAGLAETFRGKPPDSTNSSRYRVAESA